MDIMFMMSFVLVCSLLRNCLDKITIVFSLYRNSNFIRNEPACFLVAVALGRVTSGGK